MCFLLLTLTLYVLSWHLEVINRSMFIWTMLSERDGVARGSPLPGVGQLTVVVVRDYTSQCMLYDWITSIGVLAHR